MWKSVVGYEDRYEVSTSGQVRIIGKDAIGRSRYFGKLLSPHLVGGGYPHYILHAKGMKPKNVFAHILVAEAFIGPRPTGLVVNHKDGDKTNPNVENLEYITPSENHKHALDHELYIPPSGEDHWSVKVGDDLIKYIRARALAGEKHQELADEYGVSIATISRYRNGVGRAANV